MLFRSPVEAHEIAKRRIARMPAGLEEGRECVGQPARQRPIGAAGETAAQEQRPCIVVDAISMTAVGDCVNGMLEYPRVVGHRGEMVERDRWEVGLDVRPQADWPGFGHPRLAAGREPALTASLAKARGIAPRRIGPTPEDGRG